jgi:hypothetical protein
VLENVRALEEREETLQAQVAAAEDAADVRAAFGGEAYGDEDDAADDDAD